MGLEANKLIAMEAGVEIIVKWGLTKLGRGGNLFRRTRSGFMSHVVKRVDKEMIKCQRIQSG